MELRFYTLINFYLSSIQQGIQSAHLVSEMMSFEKWLSPNQVDMIDEWAKNHKTIITLNGGNNESLQLFYEFLRLFPNSPYPFVKFHEDVQSLNGTMTGVGILLPESIFNARYEREVDEYIWETETHLQIYRAGTFEYDLIKTIKGCRLAS